MRSTPSQKDIAKARVVKFESLLSTAESAVKIVQSVGNYSQSVLSPF